MGMQRLVDSLRAKGAIESARVEQAFASTDRQFFVADDLRGDAYSDRPLPIGQDQTISQPYTVALMLEDLDVREGMKVLDVGCGSGWTTALLARLVGRQGEVVGVERVSELVVFGRENLARAGVDARIVQAGEVLGLPGRAPFDRVLVSAAADSVPESLVEQLVDGGLMVVPVKNALLTVRREGSGYTVVRRRSGFRFVPLID